MEENHVTLDYGCPICQPDKRGDFELKPITIRRSLNAPKEFDCPHCGNSGHYQFRQWEGNEHIQWAIDGRLSFKYVYDCRSCGGKLTEYVTIGVTKDHSICRRCGKVRTGNLSGYR